MANLEKVIKCLEACTGEQNDCAGHTCPYWDFDDSVADWGYRIQMEKEALELLREQETSNTGKARIFQCKKCGYGFDDIFLTDELNYDIEPNYCPNCGRSVKWNA